MQLVHYTLRSCRPMLDDETGSEPHWSDDDMAVTCPDCRREAGLALKTLTDGTQVYPGHAERIKEGRLRGQQKDYVVLSESERAKGFTRPYRDAYRHTKCGTATTMGRALSETYARDPNFYSGTFCCGCGSHFPVGEDGEFVWTADGQKVGT